MSTGNESESLENRTNKVEPGWIRLRVIRQRFIMTFDAPSDKKVTEEITLLYDGDQDLEDFPLPIPQVRNGVKILDEDDSLLSFLSHLEIQRRISDLEEEMRSRMERQLENRTILWITLPSGKEIRPGKTRILRLIYFPSDPDNPRKPGLSLFDTPIYNDAFYKFDTGDYDTFFFIKPPNNYIAVLREDKTFTKSGSNIEPEIHYLKYDTPNLNDDRITIVKKDEYINARFPPKSTTYLCNLSYEIGLPHGEKNMWKIFLPMSWIILIALMIPSFDKEIMNFVQNYLFINQSLIYTISGIVATLAGALIALVNNSIIYRTKYFLLVNIALVIILLILSSAYPQNLQVTDPLVNGTRN